MNPIPFVSWVFDAAASERDQFLLLALVAFSSVLVVAILSGSIWEFARRLFFALHKERNYWLIYGFVLTVLSLLIAVWHRDTVGIGIISSVLASFLFWMFTLYVDFRAGEERLHASFDYQRFFYRVRNARKDLKFYVSYLNCLTWAETYTLERKGFARALQTSNSKRSKHFKCAFLILDPDSPSATQRAEDLMIEKKGLTDGYTVIELMRQSLWSLYCLQRYAKLDIRTKIYRNMPSVSIFQIDKTISMAPYIPGKNITEIRRFKVPITSGLSAGVLQALWDEVWKTCSEGKYIGELEPYCEVNFRPDGFEDYVALPFVVEQNTVFCILINPSECVPNAPEDAVASFQKVRDWNGTSGNLKRHGVTAESTVSAERIYEGSSDYNMVLSLTRGKFGLAIRANLFLKLV